LAGGAATIDLSFPHCWQAEILPARPIILPARHFVYPREAEEVERGALEVLVRPDAAEETAVGVGGFPPFTQKARKGWGTQQSYSIRGTMKTVEGTSSKRSAAGKQ